MPTPRPPHPYRIGFAALVVVTSAALAVAGAIDGTDSLVPIGTALGYVFGTAEPAGRGGGAA